MHDTELKPLKLPETSGKNDQKKTQKITLKYKNKTL